MTTVAMQSTRAAKPMKVMNLDDMDKAEAEEVKQLPLPRVDTGWRASLWTPMAHRNLCLACRYGNQHNSTDCLDPAGCQCPCYAWENAMAGHGMD